MTEFFANLATIIGGSFGGAIGFFIIGFFVLILITPVFGLWNRHKPNGDEGDRLKDKVEGPQGLR